MTSARPDRSPRALLTGRRWQVHVITRPDRKFLQLRARDTVTGNIQTRSARSANRREAERSAAIWEDDLNEFGTAPAVESANMAWADFTSKYTDDHLRSLAPTSEQHAALILDDFGDVMHPPSLGAVTAEMLSQYAAKLRSRRIAESTIQSRIGQLRAALRWSHGVGLLAEVPKIPKIQRAKTGAKARVMKGRPLTDSEFAAMVAAIPAVKSIGKTRAHEWEFLIRGLWLSGLRVTEAISMRWVAGEQSEPYIVVDLTGRRPLFRVPAEGEKGFRDRLLVMTPDFAEFLERSVPAAKRSGLVFPLSRQKVKSTSPLPSRWWVSHTISAIGEQAGIVVDARKKTPKFASAHDLRRSFGTRWAKLVMPQVLKELMRHESIETTMRYYVGLEAEATADTVFAAWAGHGDSLGDTARPASAKPL